MEGLENIKKKLEREDNTMRCGNFEWKVDYFDKDGKVRVELFSEEAEKIVHDCIKFFTSKDKEKKRRISHTQIRKFYNELLNYKIQLQNSQDKKIAKFRELLPYIKMQKAKAAIAYNKKHINTNFKNFIDKNIDYVVEGYTDNLEYSLKKFEIFVSLFEAVIAYSKGVINEN